MNKYTINEKMFVEDGQFVGSFLNDKEHYRRGANNCYLANCDTFNVRRENFGLMKGERNYVNVLDITRCDIFYLSVIKEIRRDKNINISRTTETVKDVKRNYDNKMIEPQKITMSVYFFYGKDKKLKQYFLNHINDMFLNGKYREFSFSSGGSLYIKMPDTIHEYKEDVFEELIFTGTDIVEQYEDGFLLDINFVSLTGMKVWIETRDTTKQMNKLTSDKFFKSKKFDVEEAFYGDFYSTERDLIEFDPPSFSLIKQEPDIWVDLSDLDTDYLFFSTESYRNPSKDFLFFYSPRGIVRVKKEKYNWLYISTQHKVIAKVQRGSLKNDPMENVLLDNSNYYRRLIYEDSFSNIQASYFSFDDVCDLQPLQRIHVVPAVRCVLLWKNYIL